MSATFDAQLDKTYRLPIRLRDESGFRLARNMAYIIIALVIALISWAAVAPIEEVANAPGRIIPSAPVSDVYHLEGGIIEKILVAEGDHVQPGQSLITLRPEQAASDLSQLQTRAANLRLKQIRLTASLSGNKPDFGVLGEHYPKLKQEHQQAFEKDSSEAVEQKRQLELAIQRMGGQLLSAKAEVESLKKQVQLQSEQVAIREKTNAMGYTSRHVLLQGEANLEETRQHLIGAVGRVAELTKMLAEAEAKLRETIAERLRKLAEDRADVAAQLAETEDSLEKYHDRVERLTVAAPIGGIVQSLTYKVRGEVIKPGSVVAQIVPDHGGVVAEVDLQPRDIGHVRVGNKAEIRLSNYDPNVVGIIRGKVGLISATTFQNQDNQPFYRVRVALDRDHLYAGGRELPISPGVTLDAQIATGSKTLLRYLLKPIYQSLETAFAER